MMLSGCEGSLVALSVVFYGDNQCLGQFGAVIQMPLFVGGEQSIKYGYAALPRKQLVTGCHQLLFVGF